jgi:hypothetical protein
LFAASQVPLALEDLFNFSKDENQIICDRIGGAISWFPHINRISPSGAATNTAKLASLFNLGASLQSNALSLTVVDVVSAASNSASDVARLSIAAGFTLLRKVFIGDDLSSNLSKLAADQSFARLASALRRAFARSSPR